MSKSQENRSLQGLPCDKACDSMALIRFTSSHCRAFLWFRGKVLHNPPDMASCHSNTSDAIQHRPYDRLAATPFKIMPAFDDNIPLFWCLGDQRLTWAVMVWCRGMVVLAQDSFWWFWMRTFVY